MRQRLRAEVMAADQRLLGAFNHQDADTMAQIFSPRLEFFHDKDGPAATMRRRCGNCAAISPAASSLGANWWKAASRSPDRRFRRDADRCAPLLLRPGQRGRLRTFRFAHVWERTPQGLQLLRVLSFDH
ncbi:MAG: hypothetical protein IPP87_24805 [Ideonella sp.]|nr:hypothetical protein [Ideonella sp.]